MSNWVFLRGLMRESRHWGDFPFLFQQYVAGAHVALVDLPGNGSLHKLPSPSRVERMLDFYRHALISREITPPYYLLGLSLGGMIAAAWTQGHPSEIHGCVLLNTSLRQFSPFYRRLRWQNYPDLCRLLWHSDIEQRERIILRLTSCRHDVQGTLVDDWIAYQREFPVSRRNAITQLGAAALYRTPMHRPSVPVLVLASESDRLVNPLCSQQLAHAWQAALVMHPTAGHDLPLDDGHWVAQQVDNWLRQGTPTEASLWHSRHSRL